MQCQYYQAIVDVPHTWFVCGILRNEDNLVFERTLETDPRILEFFVTAEQEAEFLDLMHYFISCGYLESLQKMENRLCC
ncbi:MAG: hypothetical protein US69_C0027G0015 [candidate division TM6 bacterium GW2011_GWF2_38_10]|nr:MAG: hypothetical protein US69_C0027G0015 [candidate division TM6 bacterium GW2011_GWF2_38_10]